MSTKYEGGDLTFGQAGFLPYYNQHFIRQVHHTFLFWDVGGTAADNRLFVEVVLYRYRAGIPWRDLPERFGDWAGPIGRMHSAARQHRRTFQEATGAKSGLLPDFVLSLLLGRSCRYVAASSEHVEHPRIKIHFVKCRYGGSSRLGSSGNAECLDTCST